MKRNKNQTWQQFDPLRKENNAAKEFIDAVLEHLVVQSKTEVKKVEVPVVIEEIITPEPAPVADFKPKVKKVKDVETE